MASFLSKKVDKFFKLSERKTSVKTELCGAMATFVAMSYILAVNPAVLSQAGMDKPTLVTVTALAAAVGCFFMAFMGNLPIAAAPAMGSNAYFSLVVCLGMGVGWREALGLVFYNGIIFLIISITGLREKLVYAVPKALQIGLQCGIGVFIAFFGLQSAGIIVGNPNTLVSFADISKPETQYALGGMLLVAVLVAKGYKTAVMLSIFIMTVLAMFITNSHGVKIAEMPSKIFALPHNIDQTFFKLDLGFLFRDFKTAFPVIVVLFMMDIFDSLGTIIAMGKRSGLMDENGHMENLGNALTADAFSTIAGALLGTSTTSSFVESATGIQSGAKTGLCALFVGVFFLLSLFFGQLICAIPIQAAAPALIIVGVLMMQGIKTLKFDDMSELIPAVFCMLMIAFSFKISEGLALGVISYVAIRIFTGKAKEIPLGTWLLFLLMVVLLCLC